MSPLCQRFSNAATIQLSGFQYQQYTVDDSSILHNFILFMADIENMKYLALFFLLMLLCLSGCALLDDDDNDSSDGETEMIAQRFSASATCDIIKFYGEEDEEDWNG